MEELLCIKFCPSWIRKEAKTQNLIQNCESGDETNPPSGVLSAQVNILQFRSDINCVLRASTAQTKVVAAPEINI